MTSETRHWSLQSAIGLSTFSKRIHGPPFVLVGWLVGRLVFFRQRDRRLTKTEHREEVGIRSDVCGDEIRSGGRTYLECLIGLHVRLREESIKDSYVDRDTRNVRPKGPHVSLGSLWNKGVLKRRSWRKGRTTQTDYEQVRR